MHTTPVSAVGRQLAEPLLEHAGGRRGGLGQHRGRLAARPELARREIFTVDELVVAEPDGERHDLDALVLHDVSGQIAGAVGHTRYRSRSLSLRRVPGRPQHFHKVDADGQRPPRPAKAPRAAAARRSRARPVEPQDAMPARGGRGGDGRGMQGGRVDDAGGAKAIDRRPSARSAASVATV